MRCDCEANEAAVSRVCGFHQALIDAAVVAALTQSAEAPLTIMNAQRSVNHEPGCQHASVDGGCTCGAEARADEALRELSGQAPPPDAEGPATAVIARLEQACTFYCDWYEGRSGHKPETVAYELVSTIRGTLRVLRERASSPPGAGTWQPIETAPKDGAFVLIADNGHVWPGRWSILGFFVSDEGDTFQSPTHWQPLPFPPTPTTAQEPR